MTIRRARRPFRWLRRGLLLILILVVAALGLYLFGRVGRPTRPVPGGDGPPLAPLATGEGMTAVGEGFEYTHYEGGKTVFAIRAERTLEDREETAYLEKVDLTLYEADGRGNEVVAERATYNRQTQEALLEGDVRLRGWGGVEMRAEALDLGHGGRVLSSSGEVQIRYGEGYQGRADRLRIAFPQDLFVLAGDVLVESVPGAPVPLSLRAERLILERSRQLLRAEAGVEMRLGGQELRARSVNAFFEDDLSRLRFFRGRWEVSGSWTPASAAVEPPGAPLRVEFEGRSLAVLLTDDGEGLENAQLEGAAERPAVVRRRGGDGELVLTAGYLTTVREDGGIQLVEAFGEPRIVQPIGGATTAERVLEGGRARARVSAEGELLDARFDGGVDYRDGEIEARGEWARFFLTEGTGELFAAGEGGEESAGGDGEQPPVEGGRQPVETVRVRQGEAELTAPRVAIDRGSGVLHAQGGVFALLPREAGGGATPFSDGGEPMRVESQETFWRSSPQEVYFRGEVRAWQGEGVLLSDWLRGEEEEGRLSAGGGVRTVLAPAGETAETGEPAAASPWTVTAESMSYLEQGGQAVYEGEVEAKQEGRRLACDRLEVTLGEEGRAERFACTGSVGLDDSASGNRAEGERAVYSTQDGSLELWGSPARVHDREGGLVEAPYLIYDVAAARVTSAAAAAGGASVGEEGR